MMRSKPASSTPDFRSPGNTRTTQSGVFQGNFEGNYPLAQVREAMAKRWLDGAAIGYLQKRYAGLSRLEIETAVRLEMRRIAQARRVA